MDIHHVVVATRNPTGDDPRDNGDSEEGFYQVEGNFLTMVDVDGAALRNRFGERITHHLASGDNPRQVAARLVLSRWRTDRDASEGVLGFGRRLNYSDRGWM
jgi:hypothetical protein